MYMYMPKEWTSANALVGVVMGTIEEGPQNELRSAWGLHATAGLVMFHPNRTNYS